MTIAQWQIEMAARPAPAVAGIVERSTPVLSFGDPLRAEVATLGINPSRREFYSPAGVLLSGDGRRLATADSLGAVPGQVLTTGQAREVVADCNSYFDRNPFDWFQPLDTLLTQAVGVSYYNGTACHLDLVQWATDPVWGRLGDRDDAQRLLDEGGPHLECLLGQSNVRLVLLNGAAVVRQVCKTGLAQLGEVKPIPRDRRITCRLFAGEGRGIRFVGWSTNLQSSFGVSNEFKERLAREVRGLAVPESVQEPAAVSGMAIDSGGFLPRGIRVTGKREFADLLAHWHQSSHAKTIGDVGSYGGTVWIIIDLGNHQAALNADTKRASIATYLEHVRRLGPDLPWRVIANNRGTVNKVVFGDDPAKAAGWYLYLRKPLNQPGQL